MTPASHEGIAVGIDAGGTKTEALWLKPIGTRERMEAPGINLMRDGPDAAGAALLELFARIYVASEGQTFHSVCIGLAGAGRRDDQLDLEARLTAAWSSDLGPKPRDLRVVSDGDIALQAAFGPDSGIVVIAGTGSLILGRRLDGSLVRAGGWGRTLGDDGAGYGLGRAALRAAAAAYDGGPATLITQLLAERCGVASLADLIRRVYVEGWPLQHEPVAILLDAAARNDEVAARLVQDQATRLADQVGWLAGRVGETGMRHHAALAGGLGRHEGYRATLLALVADRLPGWRLEVCARRPVEGALELAERAASRNPGGTAARPA